MHKDPPTQTPRPRRLLFVCIYAILLAGQSHAAAVNSQPPHPGPGSDCNHGPHNAGPGERYCKAYPPDVWTTGNNNNNNSNNNYNHPIPNPSSWPSAESWAALNATSGGRLIRPIPPGAVCHPGFPTASGGGSGAAAAAAGTTAYDAARCGQVAELWWHTQGFHVDDPVSTMWNQFANDSCLPDERAPCSAAGYPAYVLDADSRDVVQMGVDFARRNNIRLNVKSSGHDYQGRSTQPGSLSIWVHQLQSLSTHLDGFKPQGCDFTISGSAVTAGGGVNMLTLYEEMDKLNLTVVGGGGMTVSVGGYITGGGHSILAPRFGLAADQVLEMEVVTADGEVRVANECQNQDLFWAMRGGGGSTFGVLTSVTMTAHPTPKLTSYDIQFGTQDITAPWIYDMFGYILSQYPSLDSRGISGYGSFISKITLPTTNITVAGGALSFILTDSTSPEEITTIMSPIITRLTTNPQWPGVFTLDPVVETHNSFLAYYRTHNDTSAAGSNTYVGSHLLDAEAMQDADKLSDAYRIFAKGAGTGYLVIGNGTRNAKPRGGGNAVNPSFRRAVSHSTNGIDFDPLSPSKRAQALIDLNKQIQPLRDLAPTMGSYVNENNPAEPDWQQSFWGDNYERLLRIKRAVDPEDIFWCHPCVGNEKWEEVGYQLCRKH